MPHRATFPPDCGEVLPRVRTAQDDFFIKAADSLLGDA